MSEQELVSGVCACSGAYVDMYSSQNTLDLKPGCVATESYLKVLVL